MLHWSEVWCMLVSDVGVVSGFSAGRNFMRWIATTFGVKIGVKLRSRSILIVQMRRLIKRRSNVA
jgi:hypothetical protein